jgi:hypothetical protein
LYGTAEYSMVMQESAKARLAAGGSDRVEDLSNRTTQEVLEDHLNLSEHWGPRGTSSASRRRI